ncbi:hypothetical protein J2S43_001691 [Catenuloplanes nepalensis]|uniref:AAA+ ATPase domain-containing protein n=1 Tax=Catenuloplanes nepalensis TaxID=587533 RepID=A0ABT9MP35_9ACTN|nr:ATP-binding protein [Catenuloplanes nepalensis]MDP9793179.1 hypothetical protein [Catenuloplanes nepalensis]
MTADVTGPAREHLRLRMRPVQRALAAAADRQTARAARLVRPDLTPFCVTDEQVGLLFARLAEDLPPEPTSLDDDEREAERELRRRAGGVLPLDALAVRFRLSPTAVDALLLVTAVELDSAYERIFAYVVDDLNRRQASAELLTAVLDCAEELRPAAPLRRYGLIRTVAGGTGGLAEELTAAPGLADLLSGLPLDPGLIGHDPFEVPPATAPAPPGADELGRLGQALGDGRLDLVGLWGGTVAARREAALAVATAAGRPLRLLRPGADDPDRPVTDPAGPAGGASGAAMAEAARVAAALGAVVWVPAESAEASALLARVRLPAILTGDSPWRPPALVAARDYAELPLPAADLRQRRDRWASVLPDLEPALREELAARYRMSGEELRAVASMARSRARFAGNGRPAPLAEHVPPALSAVTRPRSSAQGYVTRPRHTLEDLVLPSAQMASIMEIAAAFRAWPRVAEAWGFGRRPGEAGVKVMFSGESGTGKTLTAEVLAGTAGLDLFVIDLSQVVSKWIGETEKNLEAAFRQAEQSHAVLFFDEADALFGKRGEVKHGTDRYANLEVGYLLQRLESSPAPAILATNLRDNLDPAFTRRFHFMVSFPRPGPAERRRLWTIAFPPEAPLADDVDLETLSRLDMTGAAIASAARSAALLAAERDATSITMRQVVAGVQRQFQRESRLLQPAELGIHGHLLTSAGPPGTPPAGPPDGPFGASSGRRPSPGQPSGPGSGREVRR